MKFLISAILGLGLISALYFYISKIASSPEEVALGTFMLTFYVGLPILIVTIAIGIVLQFRKQKAGSSGKSMKINKITYFIVLILLLLFFIKFILPNLR